MFYAEWRGIGPRHVTVSSVVKTIDRHVDLSHYSEPGKTAIPTDVKRFLQPTKHMPLDGIVRKTALSIVKDAHAQSSLKKAHAIYDWVVENSYRDPAIRGCGRGDIKSMLESGNLGGKCADLNALFVGLARAAGVPARDHYGIRIDDSAAHKTLGKSGDISNAQHCRAEFYLAGLGWVPVDPADVRQLALDEELPVTHPRVVALREKLFGAWEMNWVAFNHARDITLARDSVINELSFFMYPQAEIAGHQRDSLEPAEFAYKIVSSELVVRVSSFNAVCRTTALAKANRGDEKFSGFAPLFTFSPLLAPLRRYPERVSGRQSLLRSVQIDSSFIVGPFGYFGAFWNNRL